MQRKAAISEIQLFGTKRVISSGCSQLIVNRVFICSEFEPLFHLTFLNMCMAYEQLL